MFVARLVRPACLRGACSPCLCKASIPRHTPLTPFKRYLADVSSHDASGSQTRTRSSRRRQRQTNSSATPTRMLRDPLQPNKTDLYLASLRASGLEPSLEDIERMRPEPANPNLKDYDTKYKSNLDRLLLSFSKDQLRTFAIMYKLSEKATRASRKKVEYAESIMLEQWKWRSPSTLDMERRRATEIVTRSYPLRANELFLLLGKDGADLLELSLEYNVHMNVSADPLTLRVEGSLDALDRLTARIGEFSKGIKTASIPVPFGGHLDLGLLQRISRLSGAFIEEKETKGEVAISAEDSESFASAERLAVRASVQHKARNRILYALVDNNSQDFVSTQTSTYSLYPFFAPRGLPWTVNTSGAFRIRRVNEWLSENLYGEAKTFNGLAAGGDGVYELNGNTVNLRNLLRRTNIGSSSPITMVSASMGHVLLTTQSHAQRASIYPPFEGAGPFARIWSWFQEGDCYKTFIPSLPPPLLNMPPSEHLLLHRLVYRSLGTDQKLASTTTPEDKGSDGRSMIRLEAELSMSKPLSSSPATPSMSSSRCFKGQEMLFDVVMPNRPMDIQFTVSRLAVCSETSQPEELRHYVEALQLFFEKGLSDEHHPHPPLYLLHNGETFVLDENCSVRRSADTRTSASSTTVISESVLDLETDQKSTHCLVSCIDATSVEAWTTFLQECDRLSSLGYHPSSGKRPLDIDTIF